VAGLIDELKGEHRALLAQLEAAREVNLDPAAFKRAAVRSKALLLAHLGKEEERFYPAIEKAALSDARLNAILSLFRDDLKSVGGLANAFFARLESAQEGDDLTQAFSELATKLRSRIAKEENLLYPEFERLRLE
jgi:iron-sulfur cluster repair protein YtfE (RIC family)